LYAPLFALHLLTRIFPPILLLSPGEGAPRRLLAISDTWDNAFGQDPSRDLNYEKSTSEGEKRKKKVKPAIAFMSSFFFSIHLLMSITS
jgi:hypothetical protein